MNETPEAAPDPAQGDRHDTVQARTEALKSLAHSLGADLVGVADLTPLRPIYTLPDDLLAPYRFGVSVAVRLADAVVDAITRTDPTAVYARHYVTANALLDQITFRLCGHIQGKGYRALPVHASQQLGPKRWYGAISHKAVARGAGLGWIGHSLLLVTPRFGPRVRLATVLTDMPLSTGSPLPGAAAAAGRASRPARPGRCTVSAARTIPRAASRPWIPPPAPGRLDFFERDAGVGQPVCGLCVQACPYGQKANA